MFLSHSLASHARARVATLLTSDGLAYITPDFQPTDPMVCRTLEMRPSLWAVLFNILQEWGTASQWRQNDPTHASVDTVIAEIISMTDKAVLSGCTMIGEIKELATATVPDWLLLCDGATYDRVDYPDLYAVLDAAFIIDADTFRVPKRTDRLGYGGIAIGTQDGSMTHTNIEAEMYPHTHSYNEPVGEFLALTGEEPSVLAISPFGVTGSTGGGNEYSIMNAVEGIRFYIVAANPS